jgi:DNA uptake protein ComE-like DNA-binding protein
MFPRFRFYLRFILGMTRQEIRGVLFLCVLICLGMLLHAFLQYRARQQVLASINPIRFELAHVQLEVAKKKKQAKNFPKPYYFKAVWPAKKQQDTWTIDINAADSLAWVALPGIGPGFARRILKFKEQLGGFYDVGQLKEVYGMDTVWVERYRKRFKLGSGVYRKLQVNRLLWQEFRHPYLPYAQAKIFLNYRKQHGSIREFGDLAQIKLLDMRVWERLGPYLAFEP